MEYVELGIGALVVLLLAGLAWRYRCPHCKKIWSFLFLRYGKDPSDRDVSHRQCTRCGLFQVKRNGAGKWENFSSGSRV